MLKIFIINIFFNFGFIYSKKNKIYRPDKNLCYSLNEIKEITEKINNEVYNTYDMYEYREKYRNIMNNNLIEIINSCKIYEINEIINNEYNYDFCIPSINKLVVNEYLKDLDISLINLEEYFKLKNILTNYSTKYLETNKCIKIQNLVKNIKTKNNMSFLVFIIIILVSLILKSPGFLLGIIIGINFYEIF